MNTAAPTTHRAKRLLTAAALPLVVLLGVAGCSGNDAAGNDSTTVAPNAQLAAKSLNTGLQLHADGDLTAAAAAYKTTLKFDAKNKFAFYNLALIDEADGNYGLAEDKYRAAIKTDPAYEPALFNVAILRTARNDPQEAIALYERAVAADGKDAAAWLNLGLLQRENGQRRAGDKNVLRAIALNPDLTDPAEAAAVEGLVAPSGS